MPPHPPATTTGEGLSWRRTRCSGLPLREPGSPAPRLEMLRLRAGGGEKGPQRVLGRWRMLQGCWGGRAHQPRASGSALSRLICKSQQWAPRPQ